MQIEVSSQEADYLMQVLLQRPLGEAYALFESIKAQMAQQVDQGRQRAAIEANGPRVVPMSNPA